MKICPKKDCTLYLQALFLVRFDPNFTKRKGNMLQKVNQMAKRMNKQTDHYRVFAEWGHKISQNSFEMNGYPSCPQVFVHQHIPSKAFPLDRN